MNVCVPSAEALLKRTEEPLQTVQAEGESMLSGVMAGQQRIVQAFDAYRHSLDNIVMDDAHSQLEHLGEVRTQKRALDMA